ncbi:MAG: DNA polymerase III, subunit gamma and tau [Gammaproteobacteria bacterium RIFCSPLOWO2_02_FULL_42_14]|nr:MAG: DNA polymerase III, subunit gamma and tau [Gammaproteobacteria bacterium RIFCSPHIGHO2_02_FULL_42_43]OGT52419.1 MAG: DNA polymerase III, subunit gamma and tau [Gammaproteobacteria bacterium RIFCSPHIGHO2_12_FULL_41_25]OGT61969.1 MAG: DNA polymerase III, subunit gamma and tau [Gammaproteobacteria bacterium RIFCSPLOWO2_02_FULL_42_14]OGT86450.1 MAG: DNA polymerase III, subunit gamma and tau [Gammaproteobacteria bacterium RIFCSPLOWO2_12_FULL_42_18]
MSYLALARQWRPKKFSEVVGQIHIVKTLQNALSQQKIHHAYLFTGMHGTGKTTCARIFAKCLNCETGVTPTPCETCSNCQEINEGRFPDLYEIDAASRTKVEDTRDLLDRIPYAPTKGRFKIYLIDEVHMLSTHSFNALLKTLEEPPQHVKFLLATTDPQKLPATVLSRCLQFHLSKMSAEEITTQLTHILSSEKIKFEPEAITLVAEASGGSMRDALTLLDQCIAHGNNTVTIADTQALLGLSNQAEILSLLKAIHAKNATEALTITHRLATQGVHFARALSQLLTLLHHIAVARLIGKKEIFALPPDETHRYYQIALQAQKELSIAPTMQMGFEMMVLRMMAGNPENAKPPVKTENNLKEPPKKPVIMHWNNVINDLNLSGATLALAMQCVQQSFEENVLQLLLQPKCKALLNVRHQERIQEAMTALCGCPVRVTITITENTAETPMQREQRAKKIEVAQTKVAITNDATVQRMLKTFDASIVEESIETQK